MHLFPIAGRRRRAPRFGTALPRAVVGGLVLAGTVAPGALGAPSSRPPGGAVAPPGQGAFFGAYVESGSLRAEKQAAVEAFEAKLHRRLDIDHYYTGWNSSFPDWREEGGAAAGRVPVISLADTPTAGGNSGRDDAMIKDRAKSPTALGKPQVL